MKKQFFLLLTLSISYSLKGSINNGILNLSIKNELYLKQTTQLRYEIVWSESRKLTWEDFKGVPDKKTFPNFSAVTTSSIHFKSNSPNPFEEGKFSVKAVFNQYESWVIPERKSDILLSHEQLHFDITELYARKVRKFLNEVNYNSYQEDEIWKVLNTIKSEYDNRQVEYDHETLHGKKKEIQEKWEAIVKLELAKYEQYKSN